MKQHELDREKAEREESVSNVSDDPKTTNQYGLSSRPVASEDAEIARFVERLKLARKRMRDEESRLSQLSEEDEDNLSRFHKSSILAKGQEKYEDNASTDSYDAYGHLMPKMIDYGELERIREAERASQDEPTNINQAYRASEMDNISQMSLAEEDASRRSVDMWNDEYRMAQKDNLSQGEWSRRYRMSEDDEATSQYKMLARNEASEESPAQYRLSKDDNLSKRSEDYETRSMSHDGLSMQSRWSEKSGIYEDGDDVSRHVPKPKRGYRLANTEDFSEDSASRQSDWSAKYRMSEDDVDVGYKMARRDNESEDSTSKLSDWSEKYRLSEDDDMSLHSSKKVEYKMARVEEDEESASRSDWSNEHR